MIRLHKSLFRNMVAWHALSALAIIAAYTFILYYEIERGRRLPFDVRLDNRADRIASQLFLDRGDVDITYLPSADLSNGWLAVFDVSWHRMIASHDWHAIAWNTNTVDMGKLAVRTAVGKTFFSPLVDAAGNDMRMAVVQTRLRPLPETLSHTASPATNPVVYIVCADLYEPVSNFVGRQAYRMAGAVAIVLVAIFLSGFVVARMSMRPIARMAAAANLITPEDPVSHLPVDELPNELRRLARRFNEAFSRLGAALASERTFTASAAHELRSPVASIAARLDTLRHDDSLDPALRHQIDLVHADAARLARLSGQLLLLSRLDRAAAGEAFPSTDTDLADIARDAADAWQSRADERGISISLVVQGNTAIHGHEEWLLRAVYNLVGNAVKFTADNSTVAIRIEPTADNKRVMLSVVDAGPGIPLAERGRVFDRFYRSSRTQHTEGTGFGLAIVHDVVKAHHGETFISDGPEGKGANVTIILPRMR